MATTEKVGLLTHVDEHGNQTLLYPVTTMEAVEGLEETVDTIKGVISKFHSNIVEKISGRVVSVTDSSDLPLAGLKVFGKTVQNGTPTLDAPVPLESVGDVTVTVAGKNLLNLKNYYISNLNGLTVSLSDGVLTLNGTANALVDITIVSKNVNNDTLVAINNLAGETVCISNNLGLTGYFYNGTNYPANKTTVPSSGISSIFVRIPAGSSYNNTKLYIQIEKGSVATEWEPYKGNTLPVFTESGLPGIPVTSGGNYTDSTGKQWICDYVDFEKGQYIQRIRTQAINMKSINISYTAAASNDTSYYYNLVNAIDIGYEALGKDAMCDVLPCNTNGYSDKSKEAITVGIRYVSVRINANRVTDTSADSLRAVLPEILNVQYVLEQERSYDLSAEQLAAFAELHSNYPNTTVFNDKDAWMEVKYVADTKLYIDKKFAELATVLVNNV